METLLRSTPCVCVVTSFVRDPPRAPDRLPEVPLRYRVPVVLCVARREIALQDLVDYGRRFPERFLLVVETDGAASGERLKDALNSAAEFEMGQSLGRIIAVWLGLESGSLAEAVVRRVASSGGAIRKVRQVGEEMGLSPETLRRDFKRQGIHVRSGKAIDWVNILAWLYAREWLADGAGQTPDPVTHDGDRDGWQKHVRTLTGMSPRQLEELGFITVLEIFVGLARPATPLRLNRSRERPRSS